MYVTIAIPFYNAEIYLLDAIKSVFAQTYQKWELILIDDGSTDNSLKIAQSIKDPRVRVYSDGKNKKLAARLNEITHLAKYDYIARMDADDLMAVDRIEKQMEIIKSDSSIDLVTTGVFSTNNQLDLIGYRTHHSNTITFNEIINKKGCGIVHAAVIGKKEWFLRNPYNEKIKFGQDFELWVRTSLKNDLKIYLINEPLYYYREERSVNKNKIITAYKIERSIYKELLPFSSLRAYLIYKSYIKSFLVLVLYATNNMGLLLKKRSSNEIPLDLKGKYINNLRIIRNTVINN